VGLGDGNHEPKATASSRGGVGRKPEAKPGADEQKPDTRPARWGNPAMDRDARGSPGHARRLTRRRPGERVVSYPGRSPAFSGRSGAGGQRWPPTGREKSAEAIVVRSAGRRAEFGRQGTGRSLSMDRWQQPDRPRQLDLFDEARLAARIARTRSRGWISPSRGEARAGPCIHPDKKWAKHHLPPCPNFPTSSPENGGVLHAE